MINKACQSAIGFLFDLELPLIEERNRGKHECRLTLWIGGAILHDGSYPVKDTQSEHLRGTC